MPEPWDPGRIDDAALQRQVDKAVLTRAAGLWAQGVLAELLRSAKPSASFHHPGHTVRFPVPDDLRYAQCSCPDPAPCVHAVLAARAFRLLDGGVSSGIVSAGPLDGPVPREALDAAEGCMRDLLADGLAALGPPWRDRVRRVASECAAASLTWPAQILEELADDLDRYTARDAAFTPPARRPNGPVSCCCGSMQSAPAARPCPRPSFAGCDRIASPSWVRQGSSAWVRR